MCLYFVRSILLCEQTGYGAVSCVCILFGIYCSVNRQNMKLDRVSVFFRSTLFCEQTGYEAGSCVCILLGLYCIVNRQDMKRDRVSVFC